MRSKPSNFYFRLYNSSVLWMLRRWFRKEPSRYELAAFRLHKARGVLNDQHKSSNLRSSTLLIPSYRMDGIGIQVIIRLAVKYLAFESDAQYIHYPFIEIEHQQIDPIGQQLSTEEWCKKWETFFNLGKDEYDVRQWSKEIGAFEVTKILSQQATEYLDPRDDTMSKLARYITDVRENQPGAYIFSLGLIRQPEKCKFYFSTEFVEKIQKEFRQSNYVPSMNLYSKEGIHIAIHIRRGDVWDNVKKGNTAKRFLDRLLDENYYADLVKKLDRQWSEMDGVVHYHIFSDGTEEDFEQFLNKNGKTVLSSAEHINNINLHLRTNAMDTMYHLIHAPILFPAKSTFSLLGILFGEGKVVLDDAVKEYSHYSILSKYIDQSDRFVQIEDLSKTID